MKPHKIQAYITGFLLGCLIVTILLSLRMINEAGDEQSRKYSFNPIPPETLIQSKGPIHPSLAIMCKTKEHPDGSIDRILILEDIFPGEYIRVDEQLVNSDTLRSRQVMMADRLNLKLADTYSEDELTALLEDINAVKLDTTQPQPGFFPVKLKSHSPYALPNALEALKKYTSWVLSAEKVEFKR